jgi:leucyl/phenylalanyl-tRNA--protein transferase
MELIDKEHCIYLLNKNDFDFPTLNMIKDDLVAIGGDFHPYRIIEAYKKGIFPWFIDEHNHIHWYSPQKRMILYPDNFKLSKSLKRVIKNKKFIIKSNENFDQVIKNCAKIKRKHEDETWISNEFIEAYTNLFKLGYAFSIECYLDDRLVGGLYGLLIGDIFCGESMFSLVPNASKVAFYHLCQQTKENNIKVIDCQIYNEHLASLGAKEISRKEYFKLLNIK